MRDHDRRRDAAAHPEFAVHRELARRDRLHEVIANLIRHRFVKRAFVAVAPQVELQALELDAQLVRHVVDGDRGKIRLPGHRTQAGELGAVENDVVIALPLRIRERIELFRRLRRHEGVVSITEEIRNPGALHRLDLQSGCSHSATEYMRCDHIDHAGKWPRIGPKCPLRRSDAGSRCNPAGGPNASGSGYMPGEEERHE